MAQSVPPEVFNAGALLGALRAQEAAVRKEVEAAADGYLDALRTLASPEDLREALEGFKIVYGSGYAKRAKEAGIPSVRELTRRIQGRPNDGEGRWRGVYPLDADAPRPPRGTWVVYQLLDDEGQLLYIGSSGSFAERIKAHSYTKNFAAWRAAACDDERACRDLETALIDRYRPSLNRMIPTPRVVLA